MVIPLYAQDNLKGYYRSPLADDMPILFAGNFGELRANRFHAGLDFRVGGVPGAKLYAVAEGYIARISVSPEGFGRAVYINHPNGTTSVYGHLQNFSPKVKAYIEDLQYKRQRYSLDEQFPPETFPLEKGEYIGQAGNSGSSFGAHLHFEIRKTGTQTPINVLAAGIFKFTDNIAPVIKEVIFYQYSEENEVPVVTPFLMTTIADLQHTVNVPEHFFIAVDAVDNQNNTPNKFGVYRMEVKLDNKVVFSYRIDEFTFDKSRYVNSLMAFDRLQAGSQSFLKTYVEPGNKLFSVYKKVENKGIITLKDDEVHQLNIAVWDETGNQSECTFDIQRNTLPPAAPPANIEEQKTTVMHYDRDNRYAQAGMSIHIPAGSLYRSILFTADTVMYAPAYACSRLWTIHNDEIPLHTSGATLYIEADVPKEHRDKALMANVTKTGGLRSVGGSWKDGGMTAKITAFGDYCMVVDTIPPVITPKFKNGANLSNSTTLSIKIYDSLSGISSYKAFIDGQWALMEYDAKNNMLIYTFDPKRIKKNTTHTLLLNVTDKCRNSAALKTTFVW